MQGSPQQGIGVNVEAAVNGRLGFFPRELKTVVKQGEDTGFRFQRRVRIFPGVTLNLSKSGGSVSFGGRGARVTFGPKGVRKTVGIPGSGLYYTQQSQQSQYKNGDIIPSVWGKIFVGNIYIVVALFTF